MQDIAHSPEPSQISVTEQISTPKPSHVRENEHRVLLGKTIDKLSSSDTPRIEKQTEVTSQVDSMGKDDAHMMLPFLKESLLDKDPFYGSSQAFAQIHRAIATDSQRDMDISIGATQTLLDRESTVSNGAIPIAETLIRQIYEYRRNNGNLTSPVKNDIRMDRVSDQLRKILEAYKKGGGFIGDPTIRNSKVGNEATRIRLLNALAMTGTDSARKFIRDRNNYDVQRMLGNAPEVAIDALNNPDIFEEFYTPKYKITTPLESNGVIPTTSETPKEVTEKIDEVRQEIKDEIDQSANGDAEEINPTPITDIKSARERKEHSVDSHRITSEDSDYESPWVTYEVPNAKALYDYLKSPQYKQNSITAPIGPALETGNNKNPTIIYNERDGHMELRLPIPKSLRGFDFSRNQNHNQPFIEEYSIDVSNKISPRFNKFSADSHDSRTLLRRIDNQRSGWGVASIVEDQMRFRLNNLGEHITVGPADSLNNFKVALENALRCYRDFTTEALKTTTEGNTNPASIDQIAIVLDHTQTHRQTEVA